MKYPELFGLQASLPIQRVGRQRLEKIADELKRQGLWVYQGQRFTIIDLPVEVEGDGRRVYEIPKEIRDPDLPILVKCAEGLFGPEHKEAVIICGDHGGALKPFWTFEVPHQLRVPSHAHALFSVPEGVITIRADEGQHLRIVHHEVMALHEDKLGGAWVESKVLFEGHFLDLHHDCHFETAAKAALLKVSLPEPFQVCYST